MTSPLDLDLDDGVSPLIIFEMFSTAVRVLSQPRPVRINQMNQSPGGSCWSPRPQNSQS